MAAIENDRDILLQATSPRVIPVKIPIDQVEGLPQALKSLRINSSATTFIGGTTTSPSTITLTAQKLGGLEGSVTWTVISGTATLSPSGDIVVVQGSSVVGSSVSIQARVTVDDINYDAQITLSKLGSLASEDQVNLTTQVTGQLASGSVSGLGALALLNTVNLNTQTTGALNGQTQVTNLGSLAYANSIAANQIGAGTLAAGVIYAGTVNVSNLVGTVIDGKSIYGASVIALGGSTEQNSPIFMQWSSPTAGYFMSRGATNLISSNGTGNLSVGNSGVVSDGRFETRGVSTYIGTTEFVIDSSVLQGTLGSRIILKGVDYNTTVDGVPGTIVRFT